MVPTALKLPVSPQFSQLSPVGGPRQHQPVPSWVGGSLAPVGDQNLEGLRGLEIDKYGFTSHFISYVMLTRQPSFCESVSSNVKKVGVSSTSE